MFVRWQQYRSQKLDPYWRKKSDERARLKAILVESIRVDGKPRQKHVAFLASISIDQLPANGGASRFWYDVTTRLDRLSNRVSHEDRQRIVASIAEKVGGRPMTANEVKLFGRKQEEFRSGFADRTRGLMTGAAKP